MTFDVRPAKAEDFSALAEVQRRAVDVLLRPLYDSGAIDRWVEALEAAKFDRAVAMGEEIFLAESDGRVIGFVSFCRERASLGMWYVEPGSVGVGVGAALMRSAEALLTESCEEATTEASLYARARFESLGWEAVEEYEKPAFGATFLVTRMRKSLR